jgi:hypothetical protein
VHGNSPAILAGRVFLSFVAAILSQAAAVGSPKPGWLGYVAASY